MKPHSSTHHMLPSNGTAGSDMIALGAGKDPSVKDVASQAFASIMAQQLASSTETTANPLDAKVLEEVPPIDIEQSVEKIPEAAELNLPMTVDMLGFQAAQNQMMTSHLRTHSSETGVNHVETKLTESGTPFVVDQSAVRLVSPTDVATQVPPDVFGFQPQQSAMAETSVMKVNEPKLPSNQGLHEEVERQVNQPAKPVTPVTQAVSTKSLLNEKTSTTMNHDEPTIQKGIEAQSTRLVDDKPLKPVQFTITANTTEVLKSEVASKMPEATLLPKPSTPNGLTLASLLVQAPEQLASTVDTFGIRMRLPQAPKSSLPQPTIDKAADQALKLQSDIPLALATASPQTNASTQSTLIADKVAAVTVASKEVVVEVKPSMDRPSDTLPAWLQPSMLSPMTPALVVAHDTAVMHQRVGTAAFADEFVGQVNLWVQNASDTGAMTAELHLNPVEMGPVQIRIEIDGSSAQVSFVAQHLETRQAIEASMGMLSNTLQEAGIQLSGSGVSDQSQQQQASSSFGSRGDDAPRPWQSPQQTATGDTLTDSKQPFLDEAAHWQRPPAGQNASGLDLYA